MTIAGAFDFQDPTTSRRYLVFLSDSRITDTTTGALIRDDGAKVWDLGGGAAAVFSGHVAVAEDSLADLKQSLASTPIDDDQLESLGLRAKAAFDSHFSPGQPVYAVVGISRGPRAMLFKLWPGQSGRGMRIARVRRALIGAPSEIQRVSAEHEGLWSGGVGPGRMLLGPTRLPGGGMLLGMEMHWLMAFDHAIAGDGTTVGGLIQMRIVAGGEVFEYHSNKQTGGSGPFERQTAKATEVRASCRESERRAHH